MQVSRELFKDSLSPPQSIGALPNMAPTAPIRADGNCPKEGVELVLTNSTTSVIIFEAAPSMEPPAIKNRPPVK